MIDLEYTKSFNEIYWAYNLPLQISKDENGQVRLLNYMPRKERCEVIEEYISTEETSVLCRNTAKILRNLADLFDGMSEGKIDYIYYPDQSVEDTTNV